jgi:hypothetical protein
MKPREVVLGIVLSLLIAPLVADAQQPAKIPTIGYMSQFSGAAGSPSLALTAFLDGLKELGYVDVKTSPSNTATRKARMIVFL